MNLVEDDDLILAQLGRNPYLVDDIADVIDRVVGRSIEFLDIDGALFIETAAAVALLAGFAVVVRVETVDGLGEDAGTSGLAYATGAAEKIGGGQLVIFDGHLEGVGDGLLSDHIFKFLRAVFSCRNYKVVHGKGVSWVIGNYCRFRGESARENRAAQWMGWTCAGKPRGTVGRAGLFLEGVEKDFLHHLIACEVGM